MYIYNIVRYINLMKILMILAVPLILSMSIMLGLGSVDMGASGQANQTSAQANQTSGPQMSEKLLNLTNTAIIEFNEDNNTAIGNSLAEIQGALINASQAEGKTIVIQPPTVVSDTADEDTTDEDAAADEADTE